MEKFTFPYVDFPKQHVHLKKASYALDRIIDSGNFILGNELEKFEEEFAKYIGVKYAIGVGNGTDALYLSLKALGIREHDEVITVATILGHCIIDCIMQCKSNFCRYSR